ncbi:MAG: LD-carboxypeptidase, partial [Flavobacteriales bacterium]|nr:LD-carboxypeptidase [Flavobacteriales bacterium]
MPELIRPPQLRAGDTIAIIPTARAIVLDELRDGIAIAESWGLKVKLGAGIGRKAYQQAGTGRERAADLQAAINDPEVRAIWCARGGYGTVHVMEHLDLSPLKQDPKWFIGFSDITVLHNALANLGVASLHAQMPHNIAVKTEETKETFRKALFGEPYSMKSADRPVGELPSTALGVTMQPRSGTCEGELIGGNLSVLYSLRGTPYDIDPRGRILVLEDLDELLYHVDRMVMNLTLAGWFKDLAGLVVGGMNDMRNRNEEDPFGATAEAIIARVTEGTDYPIAYGMPFGHIADNRALVLG